MINKEPEAPTMRINTEKYRAIPMPNQELDKQMMVSTAKRSSIEARTLCSGCGTRVKKEKMISCNSCGSLICENCFKQHGDRRNTESSDMLFGENDSDHDCDAI